MTASYFFLCAIPAKFWKEPTTDPNFDLPGLQSSALIAERRIRKEVDLANERSRYTLLCKRLEDQLLLSGSVKLLSNLGRFPEALKAGYFPAWQCTAGYLALLSKAQEDTAVDRMGASFFPPEQVETHRNQFRDWTEREGYGNLPVVKERLLFFTTALKNKCGIIEIQSAFQDRKQQSDAIQAFESQSEVEEPHYIQIPRLASNELEVEAFSETGRKRHLFNILTGQIRQAIQHNEPVSFGNQAPHDVITEALHHFVFVPEDQKLQPSQLRVMYADGSEADPFPLNCIHLHDMNGETAPVSSLRVALMSMRHFELDPEIDFCWFRNRDVSRTRTLAETDRFCFGSTTEQLEESLRLGVLDLTLYHTGFEPAVLGFYRSVVNRLIQLEKSGKRNMLLVRPMYFRGGKSYQPGKVWQ